MVSNGLGVISQQSNGETLYRNGNGKMVSLTELDKEPQLFTAEEMEKYALFAADVFGKRGSIPSLNFWLASKQKEEKLMLGDCNISEMDKYGMIRLVDCDDKERTFQICDISIEQLEKIIERIKRLQK